MPIEALQFQEYMSYFTGSKYNYGCHIYSDKSVNGKFEGSSSTVKGKLITINEYKNHLLGKIGLGIIPINENNHCRFAVIDIDIYNKDLSIYVKAIERNQFPLVPFKSKSGGLHIYIFFREETAVQPAIDLLRKFAFLLSIDTLVKSVKNTMVEVFPKQTKVNIEKQEYGSWINIPYYNAEQTKTPAIRDSKALTLSEALLYIKEKQTTIEQAHEFLSTIPYKDAPPCLQLIYILNCLDQNSGRNNFIFSFGVYAKKKDEDYFEQNIYNLNNQLSYPLDEGEIDKTIVQSLKKKDYLYKCKDMPCIDFCNKKICKQREFGIGKNEGYFSTVEVGQLWQFRTFQPYYEWEVRKHGQEVFTKLRFKSEDEIIKQDAFLRLCMRELHEIPSKLKQSEWFNKVNIALKEVKLINIDQEEDTSPIMILKSLIIEFLTCRAMAETKDQIASGRVFYAPLEDKYIFRIKDLNVFLFIQKQFRYFSPGELHGIIREFGGEPYKVSTETRKQIRCISLPKEKLASHINENTFQPDFTKYSEDGF